MMLLGFANIGGAMLYVLENGYLVPTNQWLYSGELVELGVDHHCQYGKLRQVLNFEQDYWVAEANLTDAA